MTQLEAYRLERGDIQAGTECQARDGHLRLGDWVVRCPQCGSYSHRECWEANRNACPRHGCSGCGAAMLPPAGRPRIDTPRPFEIPSEFITPLRATDASRGLLAQTCARDGGRFLRGDAVISCPVCGALYHEHCWQANGYRCSRSGCTGRRYIWSGQGGAVQRPPPPVPAAPRRASARRAYAPRQVASPQAAPRSSRRVRREALPYMPAPAPPDQPKPESFGARLIKAPFRLLWFLFRTILTLAIIAGILYFLYMLAADYLGSF